MRWNNLIYVDGMLPFGLSSAPKVFNALADALEWIVAQEGVESIFHYLDDFAVVGKPDSLECQRALDILIHTCKQLGVPLAVDKQDGPTMIITFLGIIIDTLKQELRLPEDKLRRLLELHGGTVGAQEGMHPERTRISARDSPPRMQSNPLRAHLHKADSFPPKHSKMPAPPHQAQQRNEVRSGLVEGFCSPVEWYIAHNPSQQQGIFTNIRCFGTLGLWGMAQLKMVPAVMESKELIPIIVATVIWGHMWKGGNVIARCDNIAVVAVLNSRYSKDTHLMQMLRCLFFVEAHHQFKIEAVHIRSRSPE